MSVVSKSFEDIIPVLSFLEDMIWNVNNSYNLKKNKNYI